MEIRGERECKDCGTRWSYYDTGSVTCPDCGSIESVGVEAERTLHTATGGDLDLGEARAAVAERPLREAAGVAAEAAREFTRRRGFVHAGELRALDEPFLAAHELREVGGELSRALEVDDDAEAQFLALVRGADDGERPAPGGVAAPLRDARGRAVAAAVAAYRRDVARYLDANPDAAPAEVRAALERLGEHVKRVEALDGAVDPAEAETLLEAARAVGTAVRERDSDALATARARLDALE